MEPRKIVVKILQNGCPVRTFVNLIHKEKIHSFGIEMLNKIHD